MPITQRDYMYTVVRGDSLNKIAEKHGMPGVEGARKIWEHDRNSALHATGKMTNGRTVSRMIHQGNNEYRVYKHRNWENKVDRDYNRPDQIILYGGETLYIPDERRRESSTNVNDDRKETNLDGEKKNTLHAGDGKKRKVTFPGLTIRLNKSDVKDFPGRTTAPPEASHNSADQTSGVIKVTLNSAKAKFILKGYAHDQANGTTKHVYTSMLNFKDVMQKTGSDAAYYDFQFGVPSKDLKYSLEFESGFNNDGVKTIFETIPYDYTYSE